MIKLAQSEHVTHSSLIYMFLCGLFLHVFFFFVKQERDRLARENLELRGELEVAHTAIASLKEKLLRFNVADI